MSAQWQTPEKAWRKLADSRNSEERLIGRYLLWEDQTFKRLEPRLRGGGEGIPFAEKLTVEEQLAQWQEAKSNPAVIVGMLRKMAEMYPSANPIDMLDRWRQAMERLEARQEPEAEETPNGEQGRTPEADLRRGHGGPAGPEPLY